MLSWLLLLVLSQAFVEDALRELPRVRRGGRRRAFFKEVGDWGKKAVSNVGKVATNVGQDIGKGWDNGVGQVQQWGQAAVDWLNPFDCEDNDDWNDCKDIGTYNPNWMSRIPDHYKITELSIPGTHDSGALHGGAAPWHAICQTLTIPKQLNAGIRYLDIRLRHFNNGLYIHHGQVYQHDNFNNVARYAREFLQRNPTETIFMRIMSEHTASGNSKNFDQAVADVIWDELDRYGYVSPTGYGKAPWELTMGAVRGKVVFIQAFGGNWLKGSIDWDSNIDWHGLVIQDDYEIDVVWKLDRKKPKIRANMDAAINDPWSLYANHLSGTGVSFGGTKSVAKPMNNYGLSLLRSSQRGSGFGIIIADFPGKGLIKEIINKNPFYG